MPSRPFPIHRRPAKRPAWAARIVEARATRGLTQTQLAERIRRSQSAVGQYETGESEPDIATFQIIAKALRVSPGWLAFGQKGDSEALPGAFLRGQKEDRLFVWTFHQAARLLSEESLYGDLTFLIAYTRKLVAAGKRLADDIKAKEAISRAIDEEREAIRKRLDETRKEVVKPPRR